MKVLDLFSGLGGFSLGLERTGKYKTVAFCEMDKYCKLVLQKHWKGVKIYNDVKEITKARFEADGIEFPEVITGGFPCQPFSVAGKQKGTSDDRHLWPEMFRIIQEFKPRWVIGENVKGLINLQNGMVFETVCTDLEGEGYEVRAFNIPAAGVGAPHRRERIWIVAHAKRYNEIQQIQRSNGTQDQIQSKCGQEDNTSRVFSRTSSIRQTNHRHEDMENSRRTLQQGTELREKNEDEIRKEDANQLERSSSTSEFNVANANNTGDRTPEHETNKDGQKTDEGWQEQSQLKSSGHSKNVANAEQSRSFSESIGDIGGLEEESRKEKERRDQSSVCTSTRSTDVANTEGSNRDDYETISGNGESQTQKVSRDGSSLSGESSWWHTEPDVGRVAHGVPGRVHRLKALGNSIVPKIAEEIGKAIVEADDIEYQGGGAYKAMLKLFRDNLK